MPLCRSVCGGVCWDGRLLRRRTIRGRTFGAMGSVRPCLAHVERVSVHRLIQCLFAGLFAGLLAGLLAGLVERLSAWESFAMFGSIPGTKGPVLSRREMLAQVGQGFGVLALGSLLAEE